MYYTVHWSIVAVKIFKENLLTNSGLMAIFLRESYLEMTQIAQHCTVFYPDSHVSSFSKLRKSTCVQRFEECIRVICKRMSDKNFSETTNNQ